MYITNGIFRESVLCFLNTKKRKFLKVCALYENYSDQIKDVFNPLKNIDIEKSLENQENIEEFSCKIEKCLSGLKVIYYVSSSTYEYLCFAINELEEIYQLITFIHKQAKKIDNED